MDPDPQILTSFNSFGILPRELQSLIWKFCLPSRTLEISYGDYTRHRWNCKCPPISRVCQLSRYVALLHGSRVPIGLSGTHVWFDVKTDALSIDPYDEAWELGHSDMPFPNNWVNDIPVLYKHLSDPKIPLRIGSHYMTSLFSQRHLNVRQGENINTLEWVLDSILQRKHCTIIIKRPTIRLDYQTACNYGFWGPFAEQNPVYVDVENASQMQKLRVVHNKSFGEQNKILSQERMKQSISNFLRFVKMLQLRHDNIQRLPRFTFVVAMWVRPLGAGGGAEQSARGRNRIGFFMTGTNGVTPTRTKKAFTIQQRLLVSHSTIFAQSYTELSHVDT